MKTKVIKILNLIFACVIAFFVIGYTFAWFTDYKQQTLTFNASTAGGYFARGNGSETNPFIINTAQHLYNLALLQNLGKLDSKYYFKLDNDITMGDNGIGTVIAPIGNDTYPFKGEFDGNGKTISGLVVTTNKSVLDTNDPAAKTDYAFSNSVGFFGMTASGSDIKNFVLNDPVVEVYDSSKFSTVSETVSTGTDSTNSSPRTAGLAIGYVAGEASTIGVYGGTLAVRKFDLTKYAVGYKTKNSIVGYMDVSTSGNGEGDNNNNVTPSADGNEGYFISDELYKAIPKDTKNLLFRDTDTTESNMHLIQDKWLVSNNGIQNVPAKYSTKDEIALRWAEEPTYDLTSSNHFGLGVFSLITGHYVKNSTGNIDFSIRSNSPLDTTTNDKSKYSYYDGVNEAYYKYYKNGVWEDIVNKDGTPYTQPFKYMLRYRASTGYLGDGKGDTTTTHSLDIVSEYSTKKDGEYTSVFTDIDDNGVISGENYSNLPTNAVVFNVTEENASLFVLCKGTSNIYLSRILDKDTLDKRLKLKAAYENGKITDYVLSSSGATKEQQEILDSEDYEYISSSYFFFKYDYDILYNTIAVSATDKTNLIDKRSPNASWVGEMFYIENMPGVYALWVDGSNMDFQYLRASGVSNGDNGSGSTSSETNIEGIDFVEKDTTITTDSDGKYTFTADYSATGVLIAFEMSGTSQSVIVLYYHRPAKKTTNNETISVYYYLDSMVAPTFSTLVDVDQSNTTVSDITISNSGASGGYNWNTTSS
jgi:predicted ribosomally synthesized peptide with SipW-like signal peptide